MSEAQLSRRGLLTLRAGGPPPPGWRARQAAARAAWRPLTAAGGLLFEPDPRAALLAPAAPGTVLEFTAFRRYGTVGRLLLLAQRLDPPPRGVPAPLSWARDELLRPLLESRATGVAFATEPLTLRPGSVDRLVQALPPLLAVPDQAALRAAVAELVPDPAAVDAPYLRVIAVSSGSA